jgi:DNA-binding response OmpR family regulator
MNRAHGVVLFVDDDEAMLALLEAWMAGRPWRVWTASTLEQAREYLIREPLTVVVADFELSGGSGLDLLDEASICCPTAARVLLTGKGSLEVAVRAINGGSVYRFLTKPCDEETLIAALDAAEAHHAELEETARQRSSAELRSHALSRLAARYRGILDVPAAVDGAYVLDAARLDVRAHATGVHTSPLLRAAHVGADEEPRETGRRALLVDDDHDLRTIAAAGLSRAGWRVASVANATAALEHARRERFDVIVLDLLLADTDGVSLLRRIREGGASMASPAVFLTGRVQPEDLAAYRAVGAGVVGKPFDAIGLPREILRAMTRGAPAVAPADPEHDPVRAIEALVEAYDGDGREVADLISLHLVNAAELVEALRVAHATKDLLGVLRAAHTLKSTSAMFGSGLVTALADQIERAPGASQVGERIAELGAAQESDASVLRGEAQRVSASRRARGWAK